MPKWLAGLGRQARRLLGVSRRKPKTTISVTTALSLATTVFMLGFVVGDWFDDVADLRGARRDPEPARADYGEPGAPPLEIGDRFTALASKAGLLAGMPLARTAAPTIVLAPGFSATNYIERCNTDPPERHERNSKPVQTITIHTTEETSGVDAVCRYHSGLWGRIGYNWYIYLTGVVYQTLPEGVKPYAQKTHNDGDVSIALQGRTNVNAPSAAQVPALERLVRAIALRNPQLDPDDVYDHGDWSDRDQAAIRAGTWRHAESLANDHSDIGQGWAALKPRLQSAIRLARADPTPGPGPAPQPSPSPPASDYRPPNAVGIARGFWVYPRPNQATGSTTVGQATYYADQFDGRPTASGVTFSQADPYLAATFLVADGAGAGGSERTRPAWLFGSWLRVTHVDTGAIVDVRIVDTGGTRPGDPRTGFGPPHIIDLSKAGFERLAPLSRGRLNIRATVMHTPPDNGGADPCRYVPGSGHTVCYAFRDAYAGHEAAYGAPVERVVYHGDGSATQRFERGSMRWTPATGVVWSANDGGSGG